MKFKLSAIFIIATFLILFLFFGKMFSCRRLSCITMKDITNFKIKDLYLENNKSFRAMYEYKNKIMRVERVSHESQYTSSQYINANIAQIKGLFTDSLAPYPGVASNTITCEKKYQPVFNKIVTSDKLEISSFIAYLNRNLTYGSCTDNLAIYRGISAYFYCPKNKQTYHLEIITQRHEFESSEKDYQNMIKSIKCR